MIFTPMNHFIRRATLAGLLFAAPAAFAWQAPSPVRVDAVKLELVQEHRQVTGELRAVARAEVATKEEGLVIELLVREGQTVERGAVIARLDHRNFDLDLERMDAERLVAEATLMERRASLLLERNDLDAVIRLQEQGAANPRELSDAQARCRVAEARVISAERSLLVIDAHAQLLRQRIDDMVIRAPFSGVVTAKRTELGQWTPRGAAIAEIVETDVYDAWIDVPQRFAEAAIGNSVPIDIFIEAINRTFTQVQPRVIPLVDSAARTFPVAARLSNESGLLAPGMSVVASLPLNERRERLTVSKNAVMMNAGGPYVLVVRSLGDGPLTTAPMPIRPLFEIAGRVVIDRGGLSAGDRVVVEGNERLFPGAPVSIIQSDDPQPDADEPRAVGSIRVNGGR